MEWITLVLFALIAIGAIATAIAVNEIRKLLATSRPLPWTALIDLEKQLAKGEIPREQARNRLEKMILECPANTIGDWVADQACLEILQRLGLIDLIREQQEPTDHPREKSQSNGREEDPSEAPRIPPNALFG
ncbi:MAG: hypothetical protein K0U98_24830 [Deltaproteobacteria bacterium]|nr:hypothetical protein [Deltaproteobacteria bacterium]